MINVNPTKVKKWQWSVQRNFLNQRDSYVFVEWKRYFTTSIDEVPWRHSKFTLLNILEVYHSYVIYKKNEETRIKKERGKTKKISFIIKRNFVTSPVKIRTPKNRQS